MAKSLLLYSSKNSNFLKEEDVILKKSANAGNEFMPFCTAPLIRSTTLSLKCRTRFKFSKCKWSFP